MNKGVPFAGDPPAPALALRPQGQPLTATVIPAPRQGTYAFTARLNAQSQFRFEGIFIKAAHGATHRLEFRLEAQPQMKVCPPVWEFGFSTGGGGQ